MRVLALVIGIALLPWGGWPAYADDRAGTAVLRRANNRIQVLLSQSVKVGSAEEREVKAKIANQVRRVLDVEELGRRALRDHIDAISSAQLAEFLELLSALIEQSYVKALRAQLSYELRFVSERGGADREVVTEVHTTRRNRPYTMQIDYRLRKEGNRWRAYDVITDGVGLVRNYRAQFNRIIAKDGIEGLLSRMQRRYQSFQ